ncbi:hypothetical protein KUTeg_000886 [Tegillarca granosa]|uniref:VWFC domain-containing protein n=1 Tax=Tegillarca granosa TaxID=220873 RepID=A0ABQ9FWE8_TEGGR|nr:hypothetical protein KUTeg_000886 [Tegillarca granosa]
MPNGRPKTAPSPVKNNSGNFLCHSSGFRYHCNDQFCRLYSAENILRRCTDKIGNCAQYGKSVCTDSTYTQWVHTNCQAYCGSCRCVYKGVVHKQGETWKDGCTYKCTCADGLTGKYTCTGICLQWNLPDSCSMNPPAPGKCCKTPNCPSNVQVQYPDGYVAE